jgi:hypothetical protein
VADGFVGACEAPTVTELGEDRRRSDRTDAVEVGDQGTARRLTASERAQRPVKRGKLAIDHVHRSQRQRHQLAPGRRELRLRERRPASAGSRLQAGRDPLVQQLRLEPLLPSRALIDQQLAHPHADAQLEHVHGRDPRLRQLAREQQPQLQVTVGIVGLRPPLPSPLDRRLSRVGQMRAVAGPLDLLDHEAPGGRPLQRELDLTTRKLLKPLPHRAPRRRHDPATPHLTRLTGEALVRDLAAMHIQRDYDRHRDLLELRRHQRHRVRNTLEPGRSHYMSSRHRWTVPDSHLLQRDLVEMLRAERRRVVPFIGAGLSVEAGVPAADPLGRILAERANERGAAIDVRPDFAAVCREVKA